MARHLTPTWSTLRRTAGMTILSVVFVVSQGLVFVHELVHGVPGSTETH